MSNPVVRANAPTNDVLVDALTRYVPEALYSEFSEELYSLCHYVAKQATKRVADAIRDEADAEREVGVKRRLVEVADRVELEPLLIATEQAMWSYDDYLQREEDKLARQMKRKQTFIDDYTHS